MTRTDFKHLLKMCIISLIVGGILKGLGWLNGFLDVMGFILLGASTIGILLIMIGWHLDNYNQDRLKVSNRFSMWFLILSCMGAFIGSLVKLTYISIVCGVFAIVNIIVLVICVGKYIGEYFDQVDRGEPLIDDQNEEEKDVEEKGGRIKIE